MSPRHLFLACILLLIAFFRAGAEDVAARPLDSINDANRLLEEGHLAFQRGDYDKALETYVRVGQSRFRNGATWANAGAAAFRAKDNGRAVLYYSRALKLDPANSDALRSLQVASPSTNQNDANSTNIVDALFRNTKPVMWFLLGQLTFLFVCLAIGKSLAARDSDGRGHWVAVLAWSGVLTAVFVFVGFANHRYRVGGSEAVVLENDAVTRSEPSATSAAELQLPAGTLVELTESPRNGYVRFKLRDGRSGYLQSDVVEKI